MVLHETRRVPGFRSARFRLHDDMLLTTCNPRCFHV